jgi:hypothetical protein
MSGRRSISIDIGEIVLDGFAHADRDRIAEAIAGELARLFQDQPIAGEVLARSAAARIDAGSFSMEPGASAAQIGAAIAGAVHGGLKR